MKDEKRNFSNRIEYGYWKDDIFILHRYDGPAVVCNNGTKQWYIHGMHKITRLDFGTRFEYGYYNDVNFILHREDGPAIESGVMGSSVWYIDGKKVNKDNFEEELISYKVKYLCK
jgi:hypothetical protein